MARRSTARRGSAESEPSAAQPADEPWDLEPGRRQRPRAGAGGRWWVWAGRVVLWAFLLVVIVNGIWVPFQRGFAEPEQQQPQEQAGSDFPNTAAAAYALRFADAYLNTDGADGAERAEALARFLPDGRAGSFDLDSADGLRGDDIELLGVAPTDDNNAVVTLTATVNGTPMRLDVPVYATDGGASLVVSGQPALLAAPAKADLPDAGSVETDPDAEGELAPILTGFFEAYAQTPEHLTRYVEPGAAVRALPQGTMTFSSLRDLSVPVAGSDGADVREVRATVVWELAGSGSGESETPATLTQSYTVSVVKDGDSWYIRDLKGAPNSFGP